jgi:hypothetical protein
VGAAQTDRAQAPPAMSEGQAVILPVDQTPGAIAGFAVFLPGVFEKGDDLEIDRAGQRNPVLTGVCFVLGGIEFDLHVCIYDLPRNLSR